MMTTRDNGYVHDKPLKKMVTHPSTNRARRRTTTLVETYALCITVGQVLPVASK